MTNTLQRMAAAGTVALLAACGGGGGDAPSLPDTVPALATTSAQAFTQYLATLPESDTAEPLKLDGVEPPTSETAEPEPLPR